MRKHTILTNDDFKIITQYKSVVPDNNHEQRNKIKMQMLNSVINAISIDKWTRMKPSVQKSLEYMCFLSVERGFSWIAPETVGERYSVNPATIRRYISLLAKKGIISRLWRESSKRNSRGVVVCFFHAHVYFEKYWQHKFFSHEDARNEVKNKNDEISQSIKENDSFSDSTISSPYSKDLKINKRSKDDLLEYIPDHMREFAKLYGCYYPLNDGKVDEFWRMAKLAAWKNCQENSESLVDIAKHSFQQMIGQLKLNNKKIKNPISYFYGICMNLFRNEFDRECLDKYGVDLTQPFEFSLPPYD